MQVISDIKIFNSVKNPVLTIGTYDGVHLGHLKIIEGMVSKAKAQNIKSILITFDPHPRTVVQNEKVALLSTTKEKIKLLSHLGIDYLFVIPFTKAFAALSANEFIEQYLLRTLRIGEIIIGYDHQFGNNREGNIAYLRNVLLPKGIKITEIPAEEVNNIVISSSKIRKALSSGKISEANQLLGYAYNLTGTVKVGKQLGRKLGYPTANIELKENEKLIPNNGVYGVSINVQGQDYFGMMNIGNNPTIEENLTNSLEVFIFNFNLDIYDWEVKITFHQKFRDEIKFPDLASLTAQLKIDENTIRTFFHLD